MPETIACPPSSAVKPALEPAALAEQLVSALADSLEAMAFITLQPLDTAAGVPAPPQEPVRLSILVRGAVRGVVELATDRAFGSLLSSNMSEPGMAPPDAAANDDALRELMNVVCGCFLRSSMPVGCEMELPALKPMSQEQWGTFTSGPGAMVVDAEGSLVAVRATLVAAS